MNIFYVLLLSNIFFQTRGFCDDMLNMFYEMVIAFGIFN